MNLAKELQHLRELAPRINKITKSLILDNYKENGGKYSELINFKFHDILSDESGVDLYVGNEYVAHFDTYEMDSEYPHPWYVVDKTVEQPTLRQCYCSDKEAIEDLDETITAVLKQICGE